MKTSYFLLVLTVLCAQVVFGQGWEPLVQLPSIVAGATSAASDGYGVHLVGVYGGVAKHFWVGNDNTVVWSTLAVNMGGSSPYVPPCVTAYDGHVRVIMKITDLGVQKIRIYQSDNGGFDWTQLPDYIPGPPQPPIFNLYAFSDRYGTHITWDDNPSDQPNFFQNEAYYVRYHDTQGFINFKNVTDLSSPSQGGRPSVAVAGNKVSVTFCGSVAEVSEQLTSRDLDLNTETWDSFYRFASSNRPHVNISATSFGDVFYTMGTSATLVGGDCSQSLYFSYRQKDAASWTMQSLECTGGASMKKPNTLISSNGLIHYVNFRPLAGVVTRAYNPATGLWGPDEVVEAFTGLGEQKPESPMLAGGQYGNYYFFAGTYPSSHQHMRRKSFVPTITLTSPVTANWNMTGIPVALYNLQKSQVYPMVSGSVYRFENGYYATDPLSNRLGWWAQFPAQDISYTGARIDSMRMIAKNGWNIIGSISSSVPTSSVTTDPPGIVNSYFFRYQGGYVITYDLNPGGGYWVRVSQDGRIILKAPPGLLRGGDELASYDKFTVTDSHGNQQDLFVRNAALAGTTESEEMPPPAPGEEFDTRFESGDIIRTVDPATGVVDLSIAMNEVAYPVTFSWQINPENGIHYSFPSGGFGKIASSTIAASGQVRLAYSPHKLISLRGTAHTEVPATYALSQNYPNPFNPTTEIRFDLPDAGNVSLVVYDVLGREVANLANGYREAGYHSATWNASDQASGVYFARFVAMDPGGRQLYDKINKLILVK